MVAIVPHISDTWHGARAVVGSVHMDQEGEFEAPEDPAEEPTEPEIDVIEVREVEEIPLTSSIPLTPAAGVAAETTVVATPVPAASGVTEAVRAVDQKSTDQKPADQKPNTQKTAEKE